ncbi:ABC transporter substrate-binding protein [Gulosibacter macacae]|nr:ABC transporter substrate-binding protein [Gulosibacter macacae]
MRTSSLRRLFEAALGVNVSYFVAPAPIVAARNTTALKGIELNECRTSGSPEQLRGLLDGSLDLVVTALDNLFNWADAGAAFVLVGQVEPTTPLTIVAGPGIQSLADLEGHRFAVDAFDNGFALIARHLLGERGVKPRWHEVGGVQARYEALRAGETDATLLGPPFDERARDAGCTQLANVQEIYPAYPGQVLIVRADRLDDDDVQTVLAVLERSGLCGVVPEGLEVLVRIRRDLDLLSESARIPLLNSNRKVNDD